MDSLGQLQAEVRKFMQQRDWEKFHAPKNLAMGLMIESAELAEHFLWTPLEQGRHEMNLEEISDELGDILIFLVNLADRLGIDPVLAARRKLVKTRRKYPVRKVKGKSLKYDQY